MEVNPQWHSTSLELLKSPHDFSLWQKLVHFAENPQIKLNKTSDDAQVDILRASYDAILQKYPFLTKYWSAYANWEYRMGHNDIATAVFERAMRFLDSDVDMWTAFLTFKLETITDNVPEIFTLFENARLKIGYHFHSADFYALYISFLKCYATKENNFGKKYVILLRNAIEIPLYGYSSIFKEFFDIISPLNLTNETLACLIPELQLKSFRNQNQSNLKMSSSKLKKCFTDLYITTQAKSLQLFEYEKTLSKTPYFGIKPLSQGDLAIWDAYLTFVELAYPSIYVSQVYERCLIITANYSKFVIRFADYLITNKKPLAAKTVLKKFTSLNPNQNNIHCFLRLIDLEIYQGNHLKARDMLVSYLACNKNVPIPVLEKLLNVESLFSVDDEKYLLTLVADFIKRTHSTHFFRVIAQYKLSDSSLIAFYELFLETNKTTIDTADQDIDLLECDDFWFSLISILNRSTKHHLLSELQIPEKYHSSIIPHSQPNPETVPCS